MTRAKRVCSTHGCPNLVDSGRCPGCRGTAEQARGSAASRGYDARWTRRRAAYLRRHPICVLDGAIATVADHYPDSRRELIAQGVTDPDADHRLRALCTPCHGTETAHHQPGGWHADQAR